MISGSIERSDLVRCVIEAPGHVLIQAGSGCGKSQLLDQVVSAAAPAVVRPLGYRRGETTSALGVRLRVAYEEAGALVLASRVAGGPDDGADDRRAMGAAALGDDGQPWLVVVDNADELDSDAAHWLAEHVLSVAPAVRLVAAGRSLPNELVQLEFDSVVVHLTTSDLAATVPETVALLALKVPGTSFPGSVVNALRDRTAGWFTLLHAIVQRAAATRDPVGTVLALVEQNALLPALLARVSRDLAPRDQHALVALAHIGDVNEMIVAAVGGAGALERCLLAGVPFMRSVDGWISLPPPVAAQLVTKEPLERETAQLVAPLLVAAGRTMGALELFFAVGDLEAAARLLDGLEMATGANLDCSQLLAAIDRLGPVADAWPRVHLLRARAYSQLAWLAEEQSSIQTALRLARECGDQLLCRQIEAERIRTAAIQDGDGGLIADIDRLEAALAGPELPTRALLVEARANLAAWNQDAPGLVRAEVYFRHAAALWAQCGDSWLQSRALRGLAVVALLPSGRYAVASRELRRALDLAGTNLASRAFALVFLAQVAAASGDADAAVPLIAEVRELASAGGLQWAAGYADWAEIHLAALREDAFSVRMYVDQALQNLGQLAAGTGQLIVAEGADALARAGDSAAGRRLLDEWSGRLSDADEMVRLAGLAIAAHGGDPADAIAMADAMTASRALPPAKRWRIQLLKALATARAGDRFEADRLYEAGRRSAVEWEVGQLPALIEPVLCRTIDRVCEREERLDQATGTFRVKLLGGFEVWRDNTLMTVASGNPLRLVKLVAASDGAVSVDVVCEALWPETDAETGRRRLKNVLLRARETSGGLIGRRDETICFVADAAIDVTEFSQRCRAVQSALATDQDEAQRLARRALERFGTLLPDDLYEEWTNSPREIARRKASRLIDVVLAIGVDAASATWLADMVTGLDPYDDARLVRLSGMLAEHGSHALASALLDHAGEIAAALIAPTPVAAKRGVHA